MDPDARCAGGFHPVRLFFDRRAAAGHRVSASPVLRLGGDDDDTAAVVSACAACGVSPVSRMTPDDLAEPDVSDVVQGMLAEGGAKAAACDLVVDPGSIAAAGRSVITAPGALAAVPYADAWAAVVRVAGSFPEHLTGFAVGTHILERHDWAVWLANRAVAGREVSYGASATLYPLPVEEGLDPRTMNATASVRDTFEHKWIVRRAQGTRTRGGQRFAQVVGHAGTLVAMPDTGASSSLRATAGSCASTGAKRVRAIWRRGLRLA